LGTSCNNAGWDSYPPYGGVSKTPELYEVTITDIPAIFISATDGTLIPAAVNGTHILTSDIPQAIFEESWFVIISNATTTGKDVWLWVRPHPVLRSVSMGTLSNSVFGFNIDPCELSGSHVVTDEPMDYTVEWNPF
jgi:hypothetical protein